MRASPGRNLFLYTRVLEGLLERNQATKSMAAPSAMRFTSPVRSPRKLLASPR